MNSQLESIVQHARQHAPYFHQHYAALPAAGWSLSDLPIIDPSHFWAGSDDLDHWPVLTAHIQDGHVFKTGGSTSEGKLSIYTREEWQAFIHTFSQAMSSRLQPGDRVANLFYAGDLYTSFLFIHDALNHSPVPVCEYPFTGAVDHAVLANAIRQYDINVLACVPAQLMKFAHWLSQAGIQLPQIRTILYGGESLFDDQRPLLARDFPNATIASIGCASVDAGLIGASLPDCQPGEHRCFDGETLIEIIDETTGQPITEPGQIGLLVVTSLQRRLMPILRYPTGDQACWREPAGTPNRKFVLHGRAGQGHRIRVGTLSLFPAQIDEALHQAIGQVAWQLVIDRIDCQDRLTLCLAHDDQAASADPAALAAFLQQSICGLGEACESGQLRFHIQHLSSDSMQTHERSGKLLKVVDRRQYQDKMERPA